MTDKALPQKEFEKFAEGEAAGTVNVRVALVVPGTSTTNLNTMSRMERENKKFDELGRLRIIKVTL
jgi:hypothetical protein